jgi:hypothetical protein
MNSNSVTPNRRLILSAKNLYFYQQKRREELDNSNNMQRENIDNEISFNEDNGSYILGYN